MNTFSNLPSYPFQRILELSLNLKNCLFVNKHWNSHVKTTRVYIQIQDCCRYYAMRSSDDEKYISKVQTFWSRALELNYVSLIKYVTRKFNTEDDITCPNLIKALTYHLIEYNATKKSDNTSRLLGIPTSAIDNSKYLKLIKYLATNGGQDSDEKTPLILNVNSLSIIEYLLKTQRYTPTILCQVLENLPMWNSSLPCCQLICNTGINPTSKFLKNIILHARIDLYHAFKDYFCVMPDLVKLELACLSGNIDVIKIFSTPNLLFDHQIKLLSAVIKSQSAPAFNHLWNLPLRADLNDLLYLAAAESNVAMLSSIKQCDPKFVFNWDQALLCAYNKENQLNMEFLLRCGANLTVQNGVILSERHNTDINVNKLLILAQVWASQKYKHLLPELDKYR